MPLGSRKRKCGEVDTGQDRVGIFFMDSAKAPPNLSAEVEWGGFLNRHPSCLPLGMLRIVCACDEREVHRQVLLGDEFPHSSIPTGNHQATAFAS